MNDIFTELFKTFTAPLPVVPVTSISIILNDKREKLEEGKEVCIKDGELVGLEPVTHVITACRGKWNDSYFELSVINKITRELSIVKL